MLFVGVDACAKGWLGVLGRWAEEGFLQENVVLKPTFEEFLQLDFTLLAVDIPIGLPWDYTPGGRLADRLARKLLGPRARSVFSPPPRKIWACRSYAEAKELLAGHLSLQSWHILPKIKEVDKWMTPWLQQRVCETHPELVFQHLAGNPLPSKHTPAGQESRLFLLQKETTFRQVSKNFLSIGKRLRTDLLDAYAALWAAKRIFFREACRLPPSPPLDPKGLRMEISF